MRNATSMAVSAILLGALLLLPAAAGDLQKPVNTGSDNVAILGYDPVAYFTERRPVKGKPELSYAWRDADWHFASAKHRDLFTGAPERYAPQFGGHCAMALTQDVVKVVDPEAWLIVDGKLYLTFSKKGREKFRKDLPGNIEKSNDNWARLRKGN